MGCSELERSGSYSLEEDLSAVYLEPVRMLSRSYSRFRLSPAAYYPRFFATESPGKRKREPKAHPLNPRELISEQRHQEVRPLLLRAHRALLRSPSILRAIRNLRNEEGNQRTREEGDADFVELGAVWQSSLYQITLNHHQTAATDVQLFNNMVYNRTAHEMEAAFSDNTYIIPKQSSFYMSHLQRIRNLIPAASDFGYNLIVIDPPWENRSAHQKLMYQTLPNRHFLSIPVKELTHTAGAIIALWVTNREKLRRFVENELFSAWGVKHITNFYWLKVKADGSLISDIDLFHHRPYECLMLGYCDIKDTEVSTLKPIPDNKVFISVPGEYSRKPPVGELLKEYAPGLDSARCIELFAREMIPGWTSWGNEPLHFQNSRNFLCESTPKKVTCNVHGEEKSVRSSELQDL